MLKYTKNVHVKVYMYDTWLQSLEVPVHSMLAIALFTCYVLLDFIYDIQTLYSVVVLRDAGEGEQEGTSAPCLLVGGVGGASVSSIGER